MRVWSVALVSAVSVWAFWGAASAKHKEQVLPPFEATTQCMLGVLQTEPQIKNPTLVGNDWGRSPYPNDSPATITHPYLEYLYVKADGGTFTVRFDRVDDHGPLWFQAVLPGIFASGTSGPLNYGASHVAVRWRDECHVAATILCG
jgi:hypothetical protein